jgi:glycosyltransferase involved in cell wall biosynthesis
MGQGAWEDRLRAACAETATEDLVSFEGFVDERTKRRILAGAWVMALPSVMEGWGLAVVEAAAEGTPSVAFRVGGLRESIQDGRTGVLADDYDGFVLALRELLRSKSRRETLGAAARERAREFGWDATATAFIAALDEARRPATVTIPDADDVAVDAPVVANLKPA